MKLVNHSNLNLSHVLVEKVKVGERSVIKRTPYYLAINEVVEVPQAVGDIWLRIKGVELFVDVNDVEKDKQEAVAAALKAERSKIEAEVRAELEGNTKTTKATTKKTTRAKAKGTKK